MRPSARSVAKIQVPSAALIPLLLASLGAHLSALRFSATQIPALVQRGANFWLGCRCECAAEQLYSVKWYRRNEEFYRLIGAGAGDAQQQQQQWFPLDGVNVLMSASNATHVRLLNASLASEGTYACEISTQNLSTIRYEREIRVYVLPRERLGVGGLRARYSLGERVELICLADASRPAPALAWFVNGRRIPRTNKWFELEAKSAPDAQWSQLEPALSRSTLALKFRLSAELVGALADRRLNQSSSEGARLELRLQCRYKLSEVSDVTFNELQLAGAAPANQEPATLVRLAKSAANQVLQSPSPARAPQLQRALAAPAPAPDSCALGSLALSPDDPLILGEPPDLQGGGARAGRLRLSCSTIAALAAGGSGAGLCADAGARRRATVSAKLAAADEQVQRARKGQRVAAAQQLSAYLSLGGAHKWPARQPQPRDSAESADPASGAHAEPQVSQPPPPPALEAPPLLEWFINNQEAPSHSLAAHPSQSDASRESSDDSQDPLGADSRLWDAEGDSAAAAPPIDYASYFANFDSRPIGQHLALSLALAEHHFATPDSTLRLRCSSTQAQVLAVDSVSATIVATLAETPERTAWSTQRKAHQQQGLHRKLHRANGLARSTGAASSASRLDLALLVAPTLLLTILL